MRALIAMTLWTLSPLAWAQDESELYMADMHVTAKLPGGWTVPRWSDWDLDAVDRRETVQVHVGYTPYQVTVDDNAARAWAKMAADTLAERHTKIETVRARVVQNRGRGCADIELSYRYEGQQPAIFLQRSCPIDGRVVHLNATALNRNARRAIEALDEWDDALTPRQKAQDLKALPTTVQAAEGGFGATVPSGWRVPLDSERTVLGAAAADLGQNIDPDRCWAVMRPWPEGEADILVTCVHSYYSGVVDTFSAAAAEEDLRLHLFKQLPVQPGVVVEASADKRVGFLYTLPGRGQTAIRLGAVPYDQGYMLMWGFGRESAVGELEAAMRAALAQTTFSGPEGAAHPVGVIEVVSYYTTHRRSSPLVWGPPLLVVSLVGGLLLGRRKKPPAAEDL